MPINVKMPTVGILTFTRVINFKLSSFEHVNSFIISWPSACLPIALISFSLQGIKAGLALCKMSLIQLVYVADQTRIKTYLLLTSKAGFFEIKSYVGSNKSCISMIKSG